MEAQRKAQELTKQRQADEAYQQRHQTEQVLKTQRESTLAEMGTVLQLSSPSLSRVQTMAIMPIPSQPLFENHDNYLDTPSNGVHQTITTPLSTFSIDVDTGSYANVRSLLNSGQRPPADAVREEAFINYFPYDYHEPENRQQPFAVHTEIAPSPWNVERQLLRIALKGYEIPADQRQASNLVFLIDVSGSMHDRSKLPLLVNSLTMLTKQLNENDSVSIVTYAGNAGVVLPATRGDETATILNALQSLQTGGGTNGEGGILAAYQQAQQHFIDGGVNRVILATDGDFNVGMADIDDLITLIEEKRQHGISLTTLGFGRGNYNDGLMEQLANKGNGNHAYIDSLHEAQKVLVRQMSGTLQSIANDVKIQVEFNPVTVKEYRLIGYQNRQLRDEDFNNDHVDAGEIGVGHTVTALYELTLAGDRGQIDALRYQHGHASETSVPTPHANEVAQIKVRYKLPDEKHSQLISKQVELSDLHTRFEQASTDFQFATAAAAFAQKLKTERYVNALTFQEIADIARKNRGEDPFNYRGEFVQLVELAQNL
nr:VWA domain-containing protein [Thaumasiovibrio subtropicus]